MDFAKRLRPLPATAKWSDPNYYIWCGSAVRGEDGDEKYHLFYSRWPRELGYNAWVTHSQIARAVSDSAFGPYAHREVVLPARGARFWDGLCTHNPTIHRFGDQYYLYYMGNTGDGVAMTELSEVHRQNQRIGVAVAGSPDGPWTRADQPIVAPTPGFFDSYCCTNPSVTARPNGGYLMVYKALGERIASSGRRLIVHCVALSDDPIGPWQKQPDPIFTREGVAFAAEDPYIWTQDGGYFAIVKDFGGHFTGAGRSLALFQSSDGLSWEPAPHPLASPSQVTWQDGSTQQLCSLERPQLLWENGVAIALLCATDEERERLFSYNLQIPLAS